MTAARVDPDIERLNREMHTRRARWLTDSATIRADLTDQLTDIIGLAAAARQIIADETRTHTPVAASGLQVQTALTRKHLLLLLDAARKASAL